MANSPLLNLPAEVRNRIWEFAVTESPVRVRYAYSPCWGKTYLQPGITRTCKQVRTECLDMFYANNSFVIALLIRHDWSDLECELAKQLRKVTNWVNRTTTEHHKLIESIHFEVYNSSIDPGAIPHGYFVSGSFEAHRRGWQKLLETLQSKGYNRENISMRLACNQWDLLNSEPLKEVFSKLGVRGGIEVVRRAHR